MKFRVVTHAALCLLCAGLFLSAAPAALAQQQEREPGQVKGPSKYLFLSNVTIKPDRMSSFIDNENSEVQALREANAPEHYFGMVAITGGHRAIFFAGYDSFAEMQKDHDQNAGNVKLQDALKAGDASEAPDVLGSMRSIYEYREDLSHNAPVDLSTIRFFDIELFHVRSGHHQDFERLVKLYQKAFASMPDSRWATFEKDYGEGSDNTFIVVTPLTSLAGVDQEILDGNNLPKTVGADQMQVLRQLGSETIESSEADLFAVVPKMSYVPDSWIKASPDYWGKK